ncbi:MBL fold metallo-hydrolase [Rhizobium lusitanum]|uniref:MBL fold metallo-hydrolase n=1 Tax=Rhizobium lusitanum TaxID=293958 RepID=UPI00195D91EB|nr:MBL fold metallo-hydrolase [Rhizobium lusitanum]MBM7049219.1 MBL fold metallo-hydrolase [Rhizobium lusitanum]
MRSERVSIGHVERKTDDDREAFDPKIQVAVITDYLICFYDGRDLSTYPKWLHQNIDMQLGLSCYAIHSGDTAVLFDTMLYKEQILWIDAYLKGMGIRNISVINSHWDPDHIAGNFLYKDRDIISTEYTRVNIETYAQALQSGEIWQLYGDPSYPGMSEVVLPNRTFRDQMTLFVGDVKVELHEVFLHQLGSLVAYFPKDRILLAADACEDSVLFIPPGTEALVPVQITTYGKLNKFDIDRIYPSHGRFDIIKSGGYGKEFVAAMMDYKSQLISRMRDADYLTAPLESFIGAWVERNVLEIHEPYRWLHEYNVNLIYKHYTDKPTPVINLG